MAGNVHKNVSGLKLDDFMSDEEEKFRIPKAEITQKHTQRRAFRGFSLDLRFKAEIMRNLVRLFRAYVTAPWVGGNDSILQHKDSVAAVPPSCYQSLHKRRIPPRAALQHFPSEASNASASLSKPHIWVISAMGTTRRDAHTF